MPQSVQTPPTAPSPSHKDHRMSDPLAQRIWDYVSHSQLGSLWNFEGTPVMVVLKRTAKAFVDDDLVSRAAELGFYFLFALFPMLICASSVLGLTARSASMFYDKLLQHLAMVVPPSAYTLVIDTFNQTAAASTSGKVTFGLVVALWSASMGFSAIQDTMNLVYKVRETRPYWKAHGSAILVTILLAVIATIDLAVMLAGDALAHRAHVHIWHRPLSVGIAIAIHIVTWLIATALLMLIFSTIYYYAPDLQEEVLALAHAGRSLRHSHVDACLIWSSCLPALLQHVLGNLRFARCRCHSADVVLHHRSHSADRRRAQLRDTGVRR